MLTDNILTTNIYNKNPFTTNIFQSPHDDTFEFTNDTVWDDTPYIAVTGTPEILWTWSDGTTDDKATPDAVTCVGTHTLKVTPWDAVTHLYFGYRELIEEFKMPDMPMLKYLYIQYNAISSVKNREWPNLQMLHLQENELAGTFKTFAWPLIRQLFCRNCKYTGCFQMQEWPMATHIRIPYNSFDSLSGNFQTQIKTYSYFFQDNAISSHAQIDNMLSDLVINAENPARTNTCTVNFSGGTNSGPTSAGTANQNILVDTHSWTVTLNAEV